MRRCAGASSLDIVAVKRLMPLRASAGRQLVREQAAEAAARPVIGHHDGHLGRLGILRQAHVAGHTEESPPRRVGRSATSAPWLRPSTSVR